MNRATQPQIDAVERFYNTTIDFELSERQANQLLSTRNYVQAVAEILRRENRHVSRDVERVTAAWIVNTPELVGWISRWNDRRFARGTHNGDPRLRRNDQFWRVYNAMLRAFDSAEFKGDGLSMRITAE